MGYYTRHVLYASDNTQEHIEALSEMTGYLEHSFNGGGHAIKWYTHEEDMKEYSMKHPDVLFTLEGMGEDPETPWTKYFKNGKMQIAEVKLIVEEFDEEKLK